MTDSTGAPEALKSHKFFAPPEYPGAVQRSAILSRITEADWARVTVLQAPAGHGKSTTLQQIRSLYEQRGWRTAWLTLDEADNDPRRLEVHLRALISKLTTGLNDSSPPESDLCDWILNSLTDNSAQLLIILDEFQTLHDKGILELFRRLLARLPKRVRVFMGSRTVPDVGLATLMVNCVATVLSADELRFSHEEVTSFFSGSNNLGMSLQEIAAIYQKTEGWPAGLQLFKLALVNPEIRTTLATLTAHSPREMAEYLTDNVVSLQPKGIQQFLMKTALLQRMTAPLCAVVTGNNDAQAVLDYLQRSGLFLRALDAEGCWFKYHGLFANHLAESLQKAAPKEARRVHEVAAQWLLEHGHAEESLRHSLACDDYAKAADTLGELASYLISNGELVTFEGWCDQLPSELLASRIDLCIKAAYALMFLRRWAKLRPFVERLAQHHEEGDISNTTLPNFCHAMSTLLVDDDIPNAIAMIDNHPALTQGARGFAAFELGAAANLLAFGKIAAGDFDAARRALIWAGVHNESAGATFSGGYTTAVSGIACVVHGRMNDAIELCRADEFTAQAHPEESLSVAALATCQIWALYESNDFGPAELLFARHRQGIAASVVLDFMAAAYLSMVRMRDAQGRSIEASELLDQLERIGYDSHWRRLIDVVDWERVRRALASGDLKRANAIASSIRPFDSGLSAGWVPLSEYLSGSSLGRIRLALANSELTQASQDIARQRHPLPGRVYREIKLQLLETQLLHHKGQTGAAHRSLRKALTLAKPGNAIRTVVDEGSVIIELLCEELRQVRSGNHQAEPGLTRDGELGSESDQIFIERLLAAVGVRNIQHSALATKQVRNGLTETLSERECEMLRYLACGLSNKALSARMFVSENTVKFHLKNIYTKLGAATRLQAINSARQLGVIT